MANEYNNDSIKSLKGADRVRLRPSVIFGSNGLEGCCHSFFEILSNSIDEFKEGRGSKIIVTRYADLSLEVTDFGNGIPVDFNQKENAYNWELLFCEMYAGGKYGDDASNLYEYSLGLNGLGLCATQYASEFMEAEIYDGNYQYKLSFREGKPVEKKKENVLKKVEMKHKRGSTIRWKPDLKVFTEIEIPRSYFQGVLQQQAICNAGLTLVLRWQDSVDKRFEEETYCYEKGIEDYVNSFIGDDAIALPQLWSCERQGRDREDLPEYKVRLNVACAFSNTVNRMEYYHNSSFLEYGGSPDKAVRSAFVYAFDNYIRKIGKYTKNESKITFQDVQDCLVLISNSFSTSTSYENQTKKAINNKYVYEAMNEFLRHSLEVYFIEHKAEADKVAEQILVNKRSRENAEKTRLNLKKKLTVEMDIANRVEKFVDCRSKDPSVRELYIVEGDSALGSVKFARQAEFQAIMPVRGKILNCLKVEYNKILKSPIITDLIKVLGCGVDIKMKGSQESAFNIENLRWNKVVICTDADVDGYQIRTLILAMIYRLTPRLLDEGKVYIAESPLYEITQKDKTWFAYTDREKNEIVSGLTGKYTVQRSKGLGENEPEMMKLTTMDPETRRLIKVLPEEAEKTARVFDMLLGDDLEGRKQHIAECGAQYLELADI
ncbi:MAG: DNA topoisomerase [Clostridia bacterium]|nr:DNA topoisomerase [Clostridia bacterium]